MLVYESPINVYSWDAKCLLTRMSAYLVACYILIYVYVEYFCTEVKVVHEACQLWFRRALLGGRGRNLSLYEGGTIMDEKK